MKMIFVSSFCNRTDAISIPLVRAATIAGFGLVMAVSGALWAGYTLGGYNAAEASAAVATAKVHALLEEERRVITDARAEQRAHIDALALRVAQLQAHLMRLDALGERLVEIGKLDRDEFDFSSAPPVGGVDEALPDENQSVAEMTADMERIARLLSDREDKLAALEQVLMHRGLMAETRPSGRPVKQGWLSSGYGRRIDPFKGKKSYHRGLDFAGKRGSDVVAVASGVVLRSEKVSGFGNVVEIRHADGYSTLYGHNKENLVKAGDMINKGQTIALLGSTGRSSGPHVHFEVHREGKIIDPSHFVRSH